MFETRARAVDLSMRVPLSEECAMGKPQFLIRAFEPKDKQAVHAVRSAAFAPVYAAFRHMVGPEIAKVSFRDVEPQQGVWLDMLCDPTSEHTVRVITVDGEVAGFCSHSLEPRVQIGEIGMNAVHPDFAGRGLATALYRDALAAMKAAGMRVATVSTGGDDAHAPARAAYRKVGMKASIPSVHLSCEL